MLYTQKKVKPIKINVMLEFNLEESKKKGRYTIITRSGKLARVICTDKKSKSDIVLVALIDMGDYEKIERYRIDGRYSQNRSSSKDLMMLDNYLTKEEEKELRKELRRDGISLDLLVIILAFFSFFGRIKRMLLINRREPIINQ